MIQWNDCIGILWDDPQSVSQPKKMIKYRLIKVIKPILETHWFQIWPVAIGGGGGGCMESSYFSRNYWRSDSF